MDCFNHSKGIQKVLKEYALLQNFYSIFNHSLNEGFIKELTQNSKIELDTRSLFLKKSTQFRNLLIVLLGRHLQKLSVLMFKNAKKSEDTISYFKKNAPNIKMSNYLFNRFLLNSLSLDEHEFKSFKSANELFQKKDKEVIAFIGDDADMLHHSIRNLENYIREARLKNIQIFGFTKDDIFALWLKSNKPDKIVITDDFTTKKSVGGLAYLKILKLSHKSIKAIKNNDVFILTDSISSILGHKLRALNYPLSKEGIKEFILYT